jgi:Pectate lyase superfamily protein/Right handed beta helix region
MMERREFLGHVARTAVAGGATLAVGRRAWPLQALPGSARRASVVDFGADPTGQSDATAAVQKAIASLATRNARLVFPAGKYTFAASDDVLMSFRGYEGLEIFGNGAELSFAGTTQPLRLVECKDLEIHDITIDWTRPAFSQGIVRAVGDRSVTLAVDPAYPVDGSERVQALLGFEGHGKSPITSGVNVYGVGAVQSKGSQTLEIALAEHPPFKVGDSIVLLHPASDTAALRLDGCEQILLETVVFHAAPGAAAALSGCRDITLDTVRVMPHPGSGRLISTCGEGVEILDSTGTVSVQHALISETAGAGMRVQQAYWRLSEVTDPQSALLASTDGKPVPNWLLPAQGTYMQLSEAGTLKLLGEIAVIKAEAAPGGMRLTFGETLSPTIGKGTLFCLSATNRVQLKMDDCKFRGGAYAGLVAQSRARVANSSFSGYAGPAILLAPDLEHMRGPVVENVHITDCNFVQCNLTPGDERGAITIDTKPATQPENQAESSRAVTPATRINQGIRINEGITVQRNVFSQLGGPAIYCAGASWLDVESNHFAECDRLRPAGEKPRGIVLRNLDQSTITGNEATVPAKIVMTGCTDKVKVGDNGPLTSATS